MRSRIAPFLCWFLLASLAPALRAQPLTLEQAVSQALAKYPAVRVSAEQASAAAAGINLARTAYLPRADFLGQLNRATHNNVFGLLLPQPVISSITGPVLGTNSASSVWGTGLGVLVSWEPFDFGLRPATVGVAQSVRESANARLGVTRLQVGTAAADAFLTVLAAHQAVQASAAGVKRARVVKESVQVLVKNQLRPGADGSRAEAELALARTQLIQTEQAEQVSRAALAQLLGAPPASLQLQPGPLLKAPPVIDMAGPGLAANPQAVAQSAAIEVVKSREKVLDRSYYPRFLLQATTFGRGTGVHADGSTGGAAAGLGPNAGNWALGMTVLFPAFDLPAIRRQKEVELHNERAEAARYDQILQDLNGEFEKAKAALDGARRVAGNTPIQLSAARVLEQQANARYKAGLATIVDVAEAERLLVQAEIDDSLAGVSVWRALLAVRAAQGDLTPYLQQTR
ncbi:MAG TPA: TolC family protein [Bryobacterales bacterium]|nr:TolC family protein [Bryobacterales bacterium]